MTTEKEWHAQEIPQGSETGYVIYDQHDPTGRDIAVLYAAPGAKENATLMAAAPKLLEACKYLLEHWGENLTEAAQRIQEAVYIAEDS